MEIIAQWLDDLDDLVFAVALVLARLRRPFFRVGLGSASTIAAVQTANTLAAWIPALVATGLGGLAIWASEPVGLEISQRSDTLTATVSHNA
jgi:hypothetical protein